MANVKNAPTATPADATPAAATLTKADVAALIAGIVIPDPMPADATATGIFDAYRATDGAGKARVRSAVDTASKNAIRDTMAGKHTPQRGMEIAGYWQRTLDALGSITTRTAPAVDYADLLARRIVALRHAADMLSQGIATDSPWTPDGMPDDVTVSADVIAARVTALESAWSTDDMADTRKSALGYATAKIGRSGKQNDVGAAILAAFEGLPVGAELTVSQIITRAAAAGVPCDSGWNGRITARLIGGEKGCTVPGIAHTHIGADNVHGGRKVA